MFATSSDILSPLKRYPIFRDIQRYLDIVLLNTVHIYIYIMSYRNITARRCVLPGKFTWRLSIIPQHAQTPAQGQCFKISQATSPKP
jgi:hypothetical protein